KDKMKSKGVWVIMMIMLVLIGSDYNVSSVQIRSKDVADGLDCEGRYTWECSPLAVLPSLYLRCVRDCCRRCCKKHYKVLDCRSHCTNTTTGM
ncbi:hypothetical protein VIGAN_03286300, partial [Vigna angularis var. angularis]